MTSSGPIHHSRFPAQQGQAAVAGRDYSFLSGRFTHAAWSRLCGPGSRGNGIRVPQALEGEGNGLLTVLP